MTSTDTTNKPFKIEKRQVYEAYKAVKSNHGAAGVDGQTLEMFERDLGRNLYKIWNRMSLRGLLSAPGARRSYSKEDGRRTDFRCAHCQRQGCADGGQASD